MANRTQGRATGVNGEQEDHSSRGEGPGRRSMVWCEGSSRSWLLGTLLKYLGSLIQCLASGCLPRDPGVEPGSAAAQSTCQGL